MTVTAAAKTRACVSCDIFRALINSLCLQVKNDLVLISLLLLEFQRKWLLLLQQKRERLAAIALSSVVTRMTDSYQVLKVLRCLVRLHTAHTDNEDQEVTRWNACTCVPYYMLQSHSESYMRQVWEGEMYVICCFACVCVCVCACVRACVCVCVC